MRAVITSILLVVLLAGCTSPKFDKEVVCEVEGDWGQALKFITYKTYTFPDMGRFGGGKHLTAGVYFDGGLFFWRNKWLMDDYTFGPLGFEQQVAKQGCAQSTISDNVVVWLPYASPSGLNMSQIVLSEGPWSRFHRYEIPSREGPPYLSDGEGNLLTLLNWRPAGARIESGVLRIREETPLSDVFFDERGFMTREFGVYVDWEDRPCKGCDPVLWRTVESTDLGKTWKVVEWGVIDEKRLPPEVELPLKGDEYYYDVEMGKVLPMPPGAKLSLGHKYRYLDFFSKNNRSIATTQCPEKGQPVSREKGTLICSDPRSIDRYFVGREGFKPEWTAFDFPKDEIDRLKRKMRIDIN